MNNNCIRCGMQGHHRIRLNKEHHKICKECYHQLKYFFYNEEYTRTEPEGLNEELQIIKEYNEHIRKGYVTK